MNRQTPMKADIDPKQAPPRAPKTRDELVEESRAKGQSHVGPDHNPKPDTQREPDGDLVPEPATDPATTHAVNQEQNRPVSEDSDDVRAGPGDAGSQSTPNMGTRIPSDPPVRSKGFKIFVGFLIGVLLVAFSYSLM